MSEKEIPLTSSEEREVIVSKAREPDPCVFVIFGATGDLSRRKLFPSLYHLMLDGKLGENVAVFGASVEEHSEDAFRAKLREATERFSIEKPLDGAIWDQLASRTYYVSGDFENPRTFQQVRERLAELDRRHGTRGNRLFFFAIPPSIIGLVLKQLKDAELLYPKDSPRDGSWSRVIIEKPFGRDLESARTLNRLAAQHLREHDIFRVDHYLGKETVQNIIVFRFGNSIFEPIWNRKYIEHVQITAAEDIGIEGRGPFYDETGVIRDIVQNHLLQILALCAMEPPVSLKADDIRDEKTKVFRSLRPIIGEAGVKENVILGQYNGYRKESKVAPDSRTPTYAALRVMIDNWRWQGVPFYFRAGKHLSRRVTEVSIIFREIPFCLFGGEDVCNILDKNVLTLRIQPDEGITLSFLCKVPGDDLSVNSVLMDFNYARIFKKKTIHEAYERLFLDAMRGDQTLFSRADGVEHEWSFVTPIVDVWESGDEEPFFYEPGSDGPREAVQLLTKSGHFWKALD
jgi:glucose-6-phosphate 1-dehydrogenase